MSPTYTLFCQVSFIEGLTGLSIIRSDTETKAVLSSSKIGLYPATLNTQQYLGNPETEVCWEFIIPLYVHLYNKIDTPSLFTELRRVCLLGYHFHSPYRKLTHLSTWIFQIALFLKAAAFSYAGKQQVG